MLQQWNLTGSYEDYIIYVRIVIIFVEKPTLKSNLMHSLNATSKSYGKKFLKKSLMNINTFVFYFFVSHQQQFQLKYA